MDEDDDWQAKHLKAMAEHMDDAIAIWSNQGRPLDAIRAADLLRDRMQREVDHRVALSTGERPADRPKPDPA